MKHAGYKLYINAVVLYKSELFLHGSVNKNRPAQFAEGFAN
jgi:hypothetical protein